MNFNFDQTAGNSQSSQRKTLDGNMIHDVKFDGCEPRDFDGVQDPTRKFKTLDVKFSNEDGVFVHTIWEPTDNDIVDTEGTFGPQPSRVKKMMYLLKHLIDAVNPELGKKIDSKETHITAATWDQLRQFMVDATKDCVGVQTKIKLLKDKDGKATFPVWFLNYNKEGNLYMNTNFIGNNVHFTSKELDRMKKAEQAPTPAVSLNLDDKPQSNKSDFDFNI